MGGKVSADPRPSSAGQGALQRPAVFAVVCSLTSTYEAPDGRWTGADRHPLARCRVRRTRGLLRFLTAKAPARELGELRARTNTRDRGCGGDHFATRRCDVRPRGGVGMGRGSAHRLRRHRCTQPLRALAAHAALRLRRAYTYKELYPLAENVPEAQFALRTARAIDMSRTRLSSTGSSLRSRPRSYVLVPRLCSGRWLWR